MRPLALTIAGSDPSGGAGLQADLKTFHQHGAYGLAVVTLVTAQSTRGVTRVEPLAPDVVAAQLDTLFDDIVPHALKTGALGNADLIDVVASRLARLPPALPVVVDPVMVSKHGHRLIDEGAQSTLVRALLPRCTLLTPNLPEAQALLGRPVATLDDARHAARALAALGPKAVLVKGGHLEGDAVDVLFDAATGRLDELSSPRIDSPHTHGTGCTLSAAITARLAAGVPLAEAVAGAKRYLTLAIAQAEPLGHGVGPVNHFVPV